MRHGANVVTLKGVRGFKSHSYRLRFAVAFGEGELRLGMSKLRRVKDRLMYYVYILKCFDQRYYVGCTDNLKGRMQRHSKGKIPATAKRLPVELHGYMALSNKYKAFAFEKYLKSGSGRAFMGKHLEHISKIPS